jgi:hypothetical protein
MVIQYIVHEHETVLTHEALGEGVVQDACGLRIYLDLFVAEVFGIALFVFPELEGQNKSLSL